MLLYNREELSLMIFMVHAEYTYKLFTKTYWLFPWAGTKTLLIAIYFQYNYLKSYIISITYWIQGYNDTDIKTIFQSSQSQNGQSQNILIIFWKKLERFSQTWVCCRQLKIISIINQYISILATSLSISPVPLPLLVKN